MINKSNRRFLKFSFNRYNKFIEWFSVKELMTVGNEKTTIRFKRNVKSNFYLAHYRPYQGTKKRNQVAFSTKWGLGDNVVLRIMEYLTLTVSFDLLMDEYFTSCRLFICLPTLESTTFEQETCSRKISYVNTLSSGKNSCKKRNVATLNSAAHVARMLLTPRWASRQKDEKIWNSYP